MVYGLPERGHFDKLNDHAWIYSINVIERRKGSVKPPFDRHAEEAVVRVGQTFLSADVC